MGMIHTFVNALKIDHNLATLTSVHNQPQRALNQNMTRKNGTITVGKLLRELQPHPSRSLLLGQCADGLPLLMELGESELGAILVSCEKNGGKTHQLQVMADSAIQLNAPSQLQLGILTFNPSEWQNWHIEPHRKKYLQGIYAWYDPWAAGMIQTLVDLAEARRENQRLGADVLLMLDDLNFVEELSYEAQVNLHWLLEYGSQSGIWLVGAINAHQAADFRYWVDSFRTRIVGQVKSEENHEILAMNPGSWKGELEPAMFRAWLGDDWQPYRLPLLGN